MKDMKPSDVAIVGVSCHFPGANDYASYWQNLVEKKNSIQEIPDDRWCVSTHYSPNKNQPNKSISKWCGLIEDIKSFDNEFFNISPIEARNMDPQQRLLLQESWHCIEDSAIPLSTLQKAKTSVFVGAMTSDYLQTLNKSEDANNRFSILGNDHCILANRISHQLNLTGESISINAASASSLVAIHKAKSALVLGECDYAIAAGVNLNSDPFKYIVFSQAGMLSPDGQCKSFSDDANGYVPGDGVAALLLQPLHKAIEDNHHIYGVIKGSAINHIGSGKAITAPCADAQTAVIIDALKNAEKNISDVGYIEAHGSGTPLGDPIELAAISRVFKDAESDVIIGTVKPNIGHLEAAAGIAGVIKALQVLKHQYIPANLNLNRINPVINLKQSKLKLASGEYLNTHEKSCVGVSSFGFGGVSCHLVLEKYQPQSSQQKPVVPDDRPAHFVLSAKSKESLEHNIENWQQYLQSSQSRQDYIYDICASVATGREQFPFRVGFLTSSKDQLFSQLQHHEITKQQTPDATSFVFADNIKSELKLNIPLIEEHYQQLLECVESSTQYDAQKALNVFRRTDFKNTLSSVAVFNALQDLQMFPSLIEQLDQSTWAALLGAECVTLDDYLAVVLHNQNLADVIFYHPKFPLKISPNSQTFYPQYINHIFIDQFFNEVKTQQHIYQNIIDQTNVLLVDDESFIDLITAWSFPVENKDDLFNTLRNFSQVLVDDVQKAAYALVAANVSLNRFYKKWQIECGNSQDTYHISLMSDLITDKLISQSTFYQISQKQSNANEDTLIALNRRHWRVINQLVDGLKKHQHKMPIGDKSCLVEAIKHKAVNLSKNPNQITRIAIGQVPTKLKDSIDLEICDVQQWQQALLSYWLQGNQMNWSKVYPTSSFLTTPLPGYVFEKVNFWTSIKLTDSPTEHLLEQAVENPVEFTLIESHVVNSETVCQPEVARDQLSQSIIKLFANQLSLEPSRIDLEKNMEAFGLDSMAYTALCDQTNLQFKTSLTPACFYGFKNLLQVIEAVAQQMPKGRTKLNEIKSNQQPLPTTPDRPHPDSSATDSQQAEVNKPSTDNKSTTASNLAADSSEDIAIIGYAGRMPHADTLEQFWTNIMNGVDGITEIPANRWRWQDYYSSDIKAANKSNSKWGGFIPDIDCFDAAFFGISPQEAKLMDPQQRLLLETVWHALEQGGQQPASLAGTDTGVFIGASTSDYEELIRAHNLAAHASTGMNRSIIANRISFVLDLQGPSEVVDTACSSSLVAIHKAVQAIKSGACHMALAGGVNALITPTHYISYGKAGMLSPDGRCKTFDQAANGYVRAEGVGVVVLKSLSQAIKDGDVIHAVIKASGTNHGGKASSLTAPNPKAQAQLIIDTYQKAKIVSQSIDYIENHGTGTPLGDPIEINGLNLAFNELAAEEASAQQTHVCHLASLKSNIGHLEAAAGIAGTLKVLLALKHQYLPASQHIKTLNPFVKIDKNRFNILQQNTAWPSQPELKLRRAGISSFGFGGVNAHIVLEEYPDSMTAADMPVSSTEKVKSDQAKSIVLISAKTRQALELYAKSYVDHFADPNANIAIEQVAYTSQIGRNHENHRLVVCAHTIEELITGLTAFINQEVAEMYFYGLLDSDNDHAMFADKMITLWQQGAATTLAKLWVKGADIEWHSFYANNAMQRVILPVYPFAKKSHWLHASTEPAVVDNIQPDEAEIEWPTYTHELSSQHYLTAEHVVDGTAILPGVFSLVMLYSCLNKAGIKFHDCLFKDVIWQAPIRCIDSELTLQITSQTKANGRQFQVTSPAAPSSQITTYTQATYLDTQTNSVANEPIDFKFFKPLSFKDYYDQLTQVGFVYGPNFRVVRQVFFHQHNYLAKLEVDKTRRNEDVFLLDPRLLDGALQTCLLALIDQGLIQPVDDWSYVPMMIEQFQVVKQLPAVVFALIQAEPVEQGQQQSRSFNIQLLDSQKQLCVLIKQVVFKQFIRSQTSTKLSIHTAQSIQPIDAVSSTKQHTIHHMSTETEANNSQGNQAVNTQVLRQKTTHYLIQQIAKTAELDTSEINVKQPFKEYGIDSFLTLSIIRNLEDDFGDLRKTLLFEASNINELADIFINEHQAKLLSLMGMDVITPDNKVDDNLDNVAEKPTKETINQGDLAHLFETQSELLGPSDNTGQVSESHTIIKDDCLDQQPALEQCVQQLLAQYGGETIALSRKDIAPYIFICEKQLGLFYFNVHKNILLAFRYVGSEDFFLAAITELKTYCHAQQLEMNVLSEVMLDDMQKQDLVANSFGVVQRLNDISKFSLQGGQMRRLRYQVNKFKQSGHAETTEYKAGSDVAKDEAVAHMIEKWAAIKSGVNPYIWRVKDDMETGCLGTEYRVFLTHLDQSLQNVLIVSKIESDNSYLLDTEFYSNEMAMGAMEYGIYEIIQLLQQEGCDAFSLGLTFGASFIYSPHADPAVSQSFEKLAADGIFEESGNFQFKNKFRCDNAGLYLYRTHGQSAGNVLDVIMMIGNPHSAKPTKPVITDEAVTMGMPTETVSKTQPLNEASKPTIPPVEPMVTQPATVPGTTDDVIDRIKAIQNAGFNPFNLDRADIEFDLATDSWSELEYPFIKARTQLLQSKAQNNQQSLETAISEVFGLPHVLPFAAGRVAESFFCPAWPKGKKYVIQNALFPTCLFHQVNNDFIPVEVVDKEFTNRQSSHIFKGNMDINDLQTKLQEHHDDVAFVWVELADNAAGGCSVSISNLKAIKACIGSIPLVIDATRIIENAYHIATYEDQFIGQDIWHIVQEICSYADVINASLTKDFGCHCGGFIATRDADLYAQIQDSISTNGSGVSRTDRQLITQAVMDKPFILESVKRRMDAVLQLAQHLSDHGLTVVQPVGGHCVLIDPMVIDELSSLEAPLPAFLSWLYQQTGIRAGIHSVGRQRNTSMNNLIRLAVPLGINSAQIKTIADRLVMLFNSNSMINDLSLKNKPQGLFGEMKANYTVKQQVALQLSGATNPTITVSQPKTINSATQVNRSANNQAPESPSEPASKHRKQPNHSSLERPTDIAVIGMSGRYPDADNLVQFWDNLSTGKNSIKMGPDWASRFVDPNTQQHLGGFINNVDKFDSLFFSISPREAQNMDPQERLVMEVSWEALEDAGYHPESLVDTIGSQQVGVFVGAVWSYYEMLGAENRQLGGGSNANSQHWGISNRISSFMNFSGPSLTVDTACSSSLTAIHLACESLRHGECQVALASGVNLDLHPSKYHITEAAQFLSDEGLCRAFGQGGNGYVAGEGVGTLVLKPLLQAEQDGDHIYGVIKSTVINHGGRTAGYTVPSPNAQADLIAAAMTKADISAATIGYVEAHGTGTELGDPVEIQGASKAFRLDTAAKQYCSIGSVKTNIGHLEAAAGIAGATKLLLQMQHQQLVPSLHSKVLNEHIDFENSPFFVQQNKTHWKPLESVGKILPRRAGLSSFGAGGTNVHIIFEEHAGNQSNQRTTHSTDPQLIILSARKEQQLQQQASQLLTWLENSNNQDVDISQVAHTLQVGRLPMNKRMAIMADDKDMLIKGLQDYVNDQSNPSILLADSSAKLALDLFDGEESQQIIELLINNGSYHKLARLWVNGVDINWVKASRNHAQKISLPTYPFAKESHWVELIVNNQKIAEPQRTSQSPSLSSNTQKLIHPLIDTDLSTADHWEYGKQFNLNQFIFRDHIVDGLPTLPGVAYMEMARAAAQHVVSQTSETQVTTLKNLIWASPINSQCSNDIRIQLNHKGDVADYEICTFDDAGKKHVHSQGKAELVAKPKAVVPAKDIDAIKQRCSGFQSKAECYDLLATRKLSYGEPLQSIEGFHYGNKEGLTALKLPNALHASFNEFQAHPSMLDGAVQSIISLLEYANTQTQPGVPYVPFVLSELVMHKPLTENCFAHLTLVEGKKQRDDIKKINIDIINASGEVLLQMKDFSFKAISEQTTENSHITVSSFPTLNRADVMVYQPTWMPKELSAPVDNNQSDFAKEAMVLFDNQANNKPALKQASGDEQAMVVLVDPRDSFLKIDSGHYELNPSDADHVQKLIDALLADGISPQRFIHNLSSHAFLPEAFAIENDLHNGLYPVFILSQALLKNRKAIGSKSLSLTYLYHSQENLPQPSYGAVSAFFRSIKHEGANIDVKSVCLSHHPEESSHAIDWQLMVQEMQQKNDIEVMYKDRQRFSRQSVAVAVDNYNQTEASTELSKPEGVYLITGGVGGLGLLFAEELLKTDGVQLILTGRSAINADIRSKIEQLQGQVKYHCCDLTEVAQVTQLITTITEQYGRLDGVIHAAGIIKDGFLWNKELSQFATVLAAKIMGTQHLDQATKDLDLDYFILCSSIASTIGNMGQSDYAAGNRFMDDFAVLRAQWQREGSRHGKSIAINWPLWKSGGMQVNEQAEQWLFENWGMQPLATDVGLDALKFAVSAGLPVFGLVQGDTQKIQQALSIDVSTISSNSHSTETAQVIPETAAAKINNDHDLTSQSVHNKPQDVVNHLQIDLTGMVVSLLKIKASDIEFSDNMSTYGFDSVTFTEFANLINKVLEIDVTPLIFFEQETLEELTTYLLEDFADDLDEHYAKLDQNQQPPVGTEPVEQPQPVSKSAHDSVQSMAVHSELNKQQQKPTATDDQQQRKHEDIAIIGMSGVMPQSADLDIFWQNLLDEKNLVTEIPKDRWDWQKFYGEADLGNSKTEIKWGGFIPEVDKFDADFFNISPLEAELTDPQQRLFLETVWHTVEDAGYQASALSGTNTGVFVGIGTSDYHELLREQNSDFEAYTVMGWMHAVLANRISYFFNWSGPSEPIGTACSSSLVAIDRAVQAIRSGQCDQCIAGGISLILNPGLHIGLGKAAMLSPDGQCKTFDHRANGYVRSEGVGALLLKPLSQAKTDGDHIYAVIKGSAVNHGGHVNTFTTPNPKAQTAVMSMAYDDAGIDPATLTYIEAHGTGTALGDPIEIQGLLKAFKNKANHNSTVHNHKEYCALGSVKTNVGHLELAAGMAGMFKLILALKNKTIPASINFEKVNPYIKLDDTPFRLVTSTEPWERVHDINGEVIPRRAGISSFGFGGVNAHLILEEFDQQQAQAVTIADGTEQIITLSAKYEAGLPAYAQQLLGYIKSGLSNDSLPALNQLAAGLQQGREAMPKRLALVVTGYPELVEKLTEYCANHLAVGVLQNVGNKASLVAVEDHDTDAMISQRDLIGLAKLWVSGAKIDWQQINPRTIKISLPKYPFQKNRYWLLDPSYTGAVYNQVTAEKPVQADKQMADVKPDSLIQKVKIETAPLAVQGILMELTEATDKTHQFKFMIDEDCPLMADHDISGMAIMPAATYLELLNQAVLYINGSSAVDFIDVQWVGALFKGTSQLDLMLQLSNNKTSFDFSFYAASEGGSSQQFCQGKVSTQTKDTKVKDELFDISTLSHGSLNQKDTYQLFKSNGFAYGDSLAAIKTLKTGAEQAFAHLSLPAQFGNQLGVHSLHSAMVDGALQSLLGVLLFDSKNPVLKVPVSVAAIAWMKPLTVECYIHVVANKKATDSSKNGPELFEVKIFDQDKHLAMVFTDLAIRPLKPNKDVALQETQSKVSSDRSTPDQLMSHTVAFLAQMIADETKRDRSTIQVDSHFDGFGIDSFLAMRMTKKLEKEIGPVVKSVFFEHSTLNSLAEYLLATHGAGLAKLFEHMISEPSDQATQPIKEQSIEPAAAESHSQLMSATCDFLSQMVADETKHARTNIQPDSLFEAFGIDSFLAMRMTKKLEKAIGSVDKTAFFEHPTVALLAAYLIDHFTAELNQLFNLGDESTSKTAEENLHPSAVEHLSENQLPMTQLSECTIDFLAQMVAEETKRDRDQVTAEASFDGFGIDSFLAMRMTKKLERAIGPISKTAFFEHQNIADFANFLLQDHKPALSKMFAVDKSADVPMTEVTPPATTKQADYMVITEGDLANQPQIQSIINELNNQYGKENKALARTAIAPLIFLSSNQRALFNFNKHEEVALAFTYVGAEDDLQPLADEFIDYCAEQGLQGNMLLESTLKSTEDRPYSSNAFGVMQRLTDIESLTLKGSKMRRLRYQISKFKSSGTCTFTEYCNGDDPDTDQAITAMIDSWADNKNMVNPYIWTVKDQIAKGQLPKEHRVFLTHMNDQLQNVIVITQLTSENGYLMDLEFYGEDMPLGGLEYGIWHILQQLITEGHDIFSMGATFGVIGEQDKFADPKVYSILDGLQQQGAFNGEGNLQFKNKFRPNNNTLYLCRPLNDDPEKVVDVIMMIANPYTQEPTSLAIKK